MGEGIIWLIFGIYVLTVLVIAGGIIHALRWIKRGLFGEDNATRDQRDTHGRRGRRAYPRVGP